jgi:pimeloyl-ACP methyl ester carboxylesterase
MGTWQFVTNTPAIRGALLRTPDALVRGITAVRKARPGTRVALVGASLGVPPTVAAMRAANVDALVLIDGGADLGRLLHAEAGRALGEHTFTARFAQACSPMVAWMLAPLEPSRRFPNERQVPTLIVDAEDEERLPRACVKALHARFPHATVATHPGAHMRPENPEQMGAILRAVWEWLAAAGRRAPSLADRTSLP